MAWEGMTHKPNHVPTDQQQLFEEVFFFRLIRSTHEINSQERAIFPIGLPGSLRLYKLEIF